LHKHAKFLMHEKLDNAMGSRWGPGRGCTWDKAMMTDAPVMNPQMTE